MKKLFLRIRFLSDSQRHVWIFISKAGMSQCSLSMSPHRTMKTLSKSWNQQRKKASTFIHFFISLRFFSYWIVFCLNGEEGIRTIQPVNVLTSQHPDPFYCERYYGDRKSSLSKYSFSYLWSVSWFGGIPTLDKK